MLAALSTGDGIRRIAADLLQPADRAATTRLMALGLVWLTVVSGAVVLIVPAPIDLLAVVLILVLPAIGLIAIKPILLVLLSLWLIVGASGLIAATQASDLGGTIAQCGLGLFLSMTFFILAAFIAKQPEAHTRLVMHAYVWAAAIASITVMVGYVGSGPNAHEVPTTLGYMAGTLINPDVVGPFLVPPLLYALHHVLCQPLRQALLATGLALLLTSAILIDLSHGAWINLAISVVVYAYLSFATAPTDLQRLKLILITAVGALALVAVMVVGAQQPTFSQLGPEQLHTVEADHPEPQDQLSEVSQAVSVIALNPLGLGAPGIGEHGSYQPPHNVYLAIMLQTGWIGGLVFIMIIAISLIAGFATVIRRSASQPMMIIAFSAFVGLAMQGMTTNIDDWRHFYLVLAILWGLIASFHSSSVATGRIEPDDTEIYFDLEGHWRNRSAKPRDVRPATILGPGQVTIAANEPELRRDRSHRPRRPQCAAYT